MKFLLNRRKFLVLPLAAYSGVGFAQNTQNMPVVKVGVIEGFSGAFAYAGEGVYRNILLAAEQVNAAGGILIAGQPHHLQIVRLDSQGVVQNALSMLKMAIDQDIRIIMQGNGSAVAGALVAAIEKHNARTPNKRLVYLNYSAVETSLTNEGCSFWHFRFDASADMRLTALFEVLKRDGKISKVYLVGQDYSFGRYVVQRSREMIHQIRPDIEIVGEALHTPGQVKDFIPYATKIKHSGAQAIVTGNWGSDLSLLVRATHDVGLDASFYTFYANDFGAPAAIGQSGIGKAMAVNEWHSNIGAALGGEAQKASDAFYQAFRERFPKPQDEFIRYRIYVMVEMLSQALTLAGAVDAEKIAYALEGMRFKSDFHSAYMRPQDHQLQQPLNVAVMDKLGAPGVIFDNEGSGYGFRNVLRLEASELELPQFCAMKRPF